LRSVVLTCSFVPEWTHHVSVTEQREGEGDSDCAEFLMHINKHFKFLGIGQRTFPLYKKTHQFNDITS
jgi:hypothetical protein